jgi:hypothetical protein
MFLLGDYNEALPLGSNGSNNAINPDTRNSAPEIKIGTELVSFAYSAMMGAYATSADIKKQSRISHHHAKDPISGSDECIACAAIFRREEFRRERV